MLSALDRALGRFTKWRYAPQVTIALGLLLVSPSISSGLAADDWFHRLVLTGSNALGGIHHRPLDLFVFMNGDPAVGHAQQEAGLIGWWADPSAALAFFRPLSAATHWLDYQLWPNAPWAMHVHSLLWFALALYAVSRIYARLIVPKSAAALALLLFAIDDGHGFVVSWVANRNALITLALGLPVLLLHDTAAKRARPSPSLPWLAAALFFVALLGGESAVAVGGYLVSYALFLAPGELRQRLRSLLPYAVMFVVWRAAYAWLGYGTHGSGLALDPVHEPFSFLRGVAVRLPVLLLAQVATPPSDLWELFPAIHPAIQPAVLAFGLVFLGVLGWVLAPLVRRDRVARFWALGSVLSALPACAQVPSDRLLLYVAVGVEALVARLFVALVSGEDLGACRKKNIRQVMAAILAVFHLIIAPLWLPFRARGPADVNAMLSPADRTLPADGRMVVAVDPPADAFTGYVMMRRAAEGRPFPKRLRWLATGASDMVIERVDARTLRVRLAKGFMSLASERMQRSPKNPMNVGYEVHLDGLTVRVTAVTADGRPKEILARFDVPLEDPSLEFVKWTTNGYAPFTVPAIGESVELPALDFTTLRM